MNQPAQRDMTPASVEQVAAIRDKIREHAPVIRRLLATTTTTETTFEAWIANACRATPDLWKCDPETVLGATLRCAQLELAPNDGNNLAWIIPRKGKAAFQLGYGGVLELVRRAVPGTLFEGAAVYPNDSFSFVRGRTPVIKHTPYYARPRKAADGAGGPAYAWYVIARYPDGREQCHMLGKAGVDYHRSFSKTTSDDSMWNTSYDAAALKSVVLDMRRWLPQTAQIAQAVAADGAIVDVRAMHPEAPQLPTPPEQLGAGTVDDDEVTDGELDDDAQWVADAQGTLQ